MHIPIPSGRPRAAIAMAVLVLIAGTAVAAEPAAEPKLPANTPLIGDVLLALKVTGTAASTVKSHPVAAVDAPGFTKALQVTVSKRAASSYEAQYALPLTDVTFKKGEVIWAGVWARMLNTEDESGQGTLGFVLEQSQGDYEKVFTRDVSIGRDWQQIAVPARLNNDHAAGTTHLTLRVGGAAQTLEIGGLRVVKINDSSVKLADLPQTRLSYGGRAADAPWRKAADASIDKIRKGPLTVRVTDAAGKPVAGATVQVAMTQHAFPFGSCYHPGTIAGDTFDAKYAAKFAELFNVGVDEYAMKWPGWETPATRALALKCLDWMDAHHVKVRGHCLVWPNFKRLPDSLAAFKNEPAALQEKSIAHVTDEVTALKGRVTEWDVMNEPYVNNELMKICGYGIMADWFKAAHAANPDVPLLLNETSVPTAPPADQHYDALYQRVEEIQKDGGPISGVGMQAHFGTNLTAIPDLQKIYDRFATLGVPLEITELDIDVNDEQLQADYLRDLMTITFAHPNSSGIMMWGFVASHHWKPDAALFKADWTIKPSGQAWIDLVKKKWWTTADLTTSTDGSAAVRGFLGDYAITVTAGGTTQTVNASLPKDGKTVDVVLK